PVTLGLFTAWALGALSAVWWLVPLGVQSVLAWRWGRAMGPYFDGATSKSPALRRHHPLFSAWEAYVSSEPEIQRVRARLVGETGLRASEEIRS
ncbi:MAG: hypothetical protein GWM92_21410, partial [Gemmatimonadetes bacterium]|nr:hypothetical protein [Gemmatimonadota bacterium]NIT90250.1 hypothetical protein [Gemmatimonadota bacterium]NIU79541.1 hypothetical protein [Gammaproteobacteria bacterium]NIX42383.1 hypothetical protein [Gemmatimonadota bacterium]NIY41885.1 hypothetical protein [Gemmatimonadota bacterium]